MVGEKRLQVLGMGNLGDSDLSVGLGQARTVEPPNTATPAR